MDVCDMLVIWYVELYAHTWIMMFEIANLQVMRVVNENVIDMNVYGYDLKIISKLTWIYKWVMQWFMLFES